jgi:porin
MANAAGGLRRGATYVGRVNAGVDADLDKLLGWDGTMVHANVFQIHGPGLSRSNLLNYMAASSIEALPTTRLYELWLERKWLHDRFALRIGQMAADTEFINSKYASTFTNGTFGWPALLGINLPAGGPSPPLAVLGARVRAEVTQDIVALGAIYDGNSAGPGPGDPQARNFYGVNFRLNDPAFALGEMQFAYNQQGALPGVLKLGAWRHFDKFGDERFASNGVSLASPASSGVAASHRGDRGIYAVLEQSLYRSGDALEIGAFARAASSPADRNPIGVYVDGGVQMTGFLPGRPDDKLALGYAYARVSSRVRDLDRDFLAYQNGVHPRDYEQLVALNLLVQVRAGWTLDPGIQYIVHPGGGQTDPTAGPAQPLANAWVFGVRSVLKF